MTPPFQVTGLSRAMDSMFHRTEICRRAHECGAVKRVRKIRSDHLLKAMVSSCGETERSLTSARQAYAGLSGEPVVASAFHKALVRHAGLFRETFEAESKRVFREVRDPGLISRFSDIVLADSTVFALAAAAAPEFPATSHGKAAAKLHVGLSLKRDQIVAISLTSQRVSDRKGLPANLIKPGVLYIADQGYYSAAALAKIDSVGGYFISRLPDCVNPFIVYNFPRGRGQQKSFRADTPLRVALSEVSRELIDFGCYITKAKRRVLDCRVVGTRDPSGEYHLYVTNLSEETFGPREVANLYASRWTVELFFNLNSSVGQARVCVQACAGQGTTTRNSQLLQGVVT